MKKRAIITIGLFLVLALASLAFADEYTCLVGGSSAAAINAGWYNSSLLVAIDNHNGNGANYGDDEGITANNGGDCQIVDAGLFSNAEAGMFIVCEFNDQYHADGVYEITATTGGNSVTIDLAFVNVEIVEWVLGGAVLTSYDDFAGVIDFDLADVINSPYADATSNNVYIYATGICTLSALDSVTFDNNEGAANYWLYLVGCDTAYAPSPLGTQGFTITTAADKGSPLLTIDDVERIAIKNVAFLDNDSGGGVPGVGESGIGFVNSAEQYGFFFENCSFDNCYQAIAGDTYTNNLLIKDCIIGKTETNENTDVVLIGTSTKIEGGCWITAFRAIQCGAGASVFVDGTIFIGGNYAITMGSGSHLASLRNCVFYNQTIANVLINTATASIIPMNSIFWVADPAADYAILNTGNGPYIEYNNITNADTQVLSGFVTSTAWNLTFTNTDPFVNASGSDFRINWGQTIANTYVIDMGYTPYLGANITGVQKSNLGPFNYQQARPRTIRR